MKDLSVRITITHTPLGLSILLRMPPCTVFLCLLKVGIPFKDCTAPITKCTIYTLQYKAQLLHSTYIRILYNNRVKRFRFTFIFFDFNS